MPTKEAVTTQILSLDEALFQTTLEQYANNKSAVGLQIAIHDCISISRGESYTPFVEVLSRDGVRRFGVPEYMTVITASKNVRQVKNPFWTLIGDYEQLTHHDVGVLKVEGKIRGSAFQDYQEDVFIVNLDEFIKEGFREMLIKPCINGDHVFVPSIEG